MGYKEQSRKDWGNRDEAEKLSIEEVNCGALLRIAEATEKMGRRYTALIDDVDSLTRQVGFLRKDRDKLIRSNAALRGHITRLTRIIEGAMEIER